MIMDTLEVFAGIVLGAVLLFMGAVYFLDSVLVAHPRGAGVFLLMLSLSLAVGGFCLLMLHVWRIGSLMMEWFE